MKKLTSLGRAVWRCVIAVVSTITFLQGTSMSLWGQPQLDTTGRWEVLDPGIHPVPDGGERGFTGVFFRDSLHGYLAGRDHAYSNHATTDGGATWSLLPATVPLPHTLYPTGYGFSPRSYITHDSGKVWSQLKLDHTDPAFTGYKALSTIATATPSTIVATADYEHSYYDSSEQRMVYGRTTRLLISTDGGAKWVPADSIYIADRGNGFEPLVARTTSIGALPVPDTVPNAYTGWVRVLHMPDSVTCYILSYASWVRQGDWRMRTHYYLGKLDLRTMSVEWHPLPAWHDIDIRFARSEDFDITWVTPELAVTNATPYDTTKAGALFRSIDGGITWEKITTPNWLATRTARFFSPNEIVTGNGSTTDGGVTWHPRGNFNWGSGTDMVNATASGIYPITRAHHIMVDRHLVAHSYDAGSTWRRNHAWGVPLASAARDGHVVIGWSARAITRSTDAGRTWSEAGVDGTDLPERLHQILALAHVGDVTDELLAVAQFAADTTSYFGTMRSTDGGATWKEETRLPWLDAHTVARTPGPLRLQFAIGGAGAISGWGSPLKSDDGGRTWIASGPVKLGNVVAVTPDHALGYHYAGDTLKIVETDDGWTTWRERYSGVLSPLLSVDVLNANDYRFLCKHDELRSSDGGLTWTLGYHSDADSRPAGGLVHRLDSLHLYVLDNVVWWYSNDGGRRYQMLIMNRAGARSAYNWLISSHDDDYIYIPGADNRFARWRLDHQQSAVPAIVGEARQGMLLENLLHGDRVHLRVRLDRPAEVHAAIIDMLGSEVAARSEKSMEAGEQIVHLDLDDIPSGRYLLTLRVNDAVEVHPLVIVR